MIYGYGRPSGISWSILGTGADFSSDVLLSDGHPSHLTAIQWLSEVSPTTSDYIDLIGSWVGEKAIQSIALIGLSCGPNVKIEVTGRRTGDAGYTYDLGGNSLTQLTYAESDGRIICIILGDDGLDSLTGIQIRVFNDQNGSVWADASTDFRIGEINVQGLVTLVGEADWSKGRSDPSLRTRTLDAGLHIVPRQSHRSFAINLAPEFVAQVRQSGLENGQDWDTLEAESMGNSRTLVVIRTDSPEEIHKTCLFGIATWSPAIHAAGPLYKSAISMEEIR